jgi:hypothetical protein
MSRTELFDILLQHIYHNPNDFWIIPTWCEDELKITDRNLIDSIVEELNDRDWVTHKTSRNFSVRINYNGQQIIENYGSYSSFLRDLKKSDNKDQVQKRTDRALNIISKTSAIFFGLTSLIIGYNKFFIDDLIIAKQKIEIESLNNKIDSIAIEKQNQIIKLKKIDNIKH